MRLRIVIERTFENEELQEPKRQYLIQIETEQEGIRLMQLLGRLGNDIQKEWMLAE